MADFENAEAFYNYIKEKGFGVVEEYLINHDKIREVYKPALNTMRMITIIGDDGQPHLFFAAQKFGVRHGDFGRIDGHLGRCVRCGQCGKLPFGRKVVIERYLHGVNRGGRKAIVGLRAGKLYGRRVFEIVHGVSGISRCVQDEF